MPNKNIVMIVAGGTGQRFNSEIPKQYHILDDQTIIEKTVSVFLSHSQIDEIYIVVAKDDALIDQANFINNEKVKILKCAGSVRRESVKNGLNAIAKLDGIILIHDACRPFVTEKIITDIMNATKPRTASAPAIRIIDAVKRINKHEIIDDEDRNSLVRIQTPQSFVFQEILVAHNEYNQENADDDIQVYLSTNKGKAVWVEGSEENIKITTRKDMSINHEELRIGSGFDVHKFTKEKNYIMLGGLRIECGFGVEAHSDGDVILHAIADAMLGALGENDIGFHFPGTEKYKDADSKTFIDVILELAKNQKASIINVDVTVIAETPKISKYRDEIRKSVAATLKIVESRVNIKATTTEKMGFLGRKEGIAAEAVMLMKLFNNAK